jgi:hypothetical protein
MLAGCTQTIRGESSEWPTIVNSAEVKRANFCKSLDGKPLFSALYGVYTVTLIELKGVSVQEEQSGAVNKISSESTAKDDDLREIKTTQNAYL